MLNKNMKEAKTNLIELKNETYELNAKLTFLENEN
ncbi:hypothetical protein MCAV_01960 [[Mycoplasma] cavipharyngis]